MHHKFSRALFALGALTVLGCDIQPVSVGEWDTEINGPDGLRQWLWTITDAPALIISAETVIEVNEVELAGSRFSWTGSAASQFFTTNETSRVNFNGTVDGNRFAGTLYTQIGNFTVRGVRREN